MEEFKQAVLNLFNHHGVKQKEMHEVIRHVLSESVKGKPSDRVVYNACHGGFRYADEFEAFVGQYIQNERTETVQHFVPFAEHILATQDPVLLKVLYIYERYDFRCIFAKLHVIMSNREDNNRINRNIDAITSYLSDSETSAKPTATVKMLSSIKYHLCSKNLNVRDFHPDDLRAIVNNNEGGKLLAKNAAVNDKLAAEIIALFPRANVDDMVDYVRSVAGKHLIKSQNKRFLRLLSAYDIRSVELWTRQPHYNTTAIMYLMNRIDAFADCEHEYDPVVMHKTKERFGLLCAGSQYAMLKIFDVPAGLDWRITEYDGLEAVAIV